MNDVAIGKISVPFNFSTPLERIETIAGMWDYKQDNRPLPHALALLIGHASDDELRRYFLELCGLIKHDEPLYSEEGLKTAAKALEILGFFHGIRCEDNSTGPCLGMLISVALETVKREIDQFTP